MSYKKKQYTLAEYNAEMRDFYKDIEKVRVLVSINTPLNRSLPKEARDELFGMRRDLWNKRVSLTLRRAFMGIPENEIKHILDVFDFDEISKGDTRELSAKTKALLKALDKTIKALKHEEKEHPRAEELKKKISSMERVYFALQAGQNSMDDFIKTLDRVSTDKNSGLAQSALDAVFMAAGAFMLGACTVIIAPLNYLKYYYSVVGWQMGVVSNVYEHSDLLSYPTSFLTWERSSFAIFTLHTLKNLLILPIVIGVVKIMAELNAAGLVVRDTYRGAKHGARLAKATTNSEYGNKVKLLQALDEIVDLNSPTYTSATLLQRLLDTANPLAVKKISTDFELSTNAKSRLSSVAADLSGLLVKHFVARAKLLKTAYENAVKANDGNAAMEIYQEYKNLRYSWDTITLPLRLKVFDGHKVEDTISAIQDYVQSTRNALQQIIPDDEFESDKRRPAVVFKYGLHADSKLTQSGAELKNLDSRIQEIQRARGNSV